MSFWLQLVGFDILGGYSRLCVMHFKDKWGQPIIRSTACHPYSTPIAAIRHLNAVRVRYILWSTSIWLTCDELHFLFLFSISYVSGGYLILFCISCFVRILFLVSFPSASTSLSGGMLSLLSFSYSSSSSLHKRVGRLEAICLLLFLLRFFIVV